MSMTVKEFEALKPKNKEYTVSAGDGLSIRILPTGVKQFQYRYKMAGDKSAKRYRLGNYPENSLKQARDLLFEARKKVRNGVDIAEKKREKKAKRKAEPTVNEAFDEFKERYLLKELKAPEKQISYFEKDISPAIGKKKIKEVTRRQLIMILDKIVDRNAPIQANRTLSSMKKFFGYCVGRGIIDDNPAFQIAKSEVGGKEKPGNRFLSLDEIKRFFERIDTAPFSKTVQLVLKILLLTGQRSGEVCNAEWPEIDFKKRIWTIPAKKAKNGIENRVPLHDMAIECFEDLKQLSVYIDPEPKESRFVCQSPQIRREIKRNRKSDAILKEIPILVTTVNRSINRLNEIGYYSAYSQDNYFNSEEESIDCHFGLKKWIPHDLRRTVATQLNELGVLPHVVEKILNHKMQGVMAVYNKAEYFDERVEALKIWQEKIIQILAGQKVVSIRKEA
ncbi:MAG: site-specific integrase [Deltaproteobacteria bacterium]|jgi:integrase|nr:site-specific integrase [Deltaproteobacteria bacterium]